MRLSGWTLIFPSQKSHSDRLLENFKLELQRQYPHLTEKRIQVGDRRASGWRDLEFVSEVTEN